MKKAAAALEQRVAELQLLHETAARLTSLLDVRELLPEMVEQLSGTGVAAVLFGFVVMLVLGMVFSTLGGLLGGIVFRRDGQAVANDTP